MVDYTICAMHHPRNRKKARAEIRKLKTITGYLLQDLQRKLDTLGRQLQLGGMAAGHEQQVYVGSNCRDDEHPTLDDYYTLLTIGHSFPRP